MKKSFSIPSSSMPMKKMKKKNKVKVSYPTFLHRKMEEKQLKLKKYLKMKYFFYHSMQWDSKFSYRDFSTQFESQFHQANFRSVKNTKSCILTGKTFISSHSNINSRILKSLVEKGEITNLKKSVW